MITLFKASRTSVGARFNSSKMIQYPFLMASTSTPVKKDGKATMLNAHFKCEVLVFGILPLFLF